MTIKGRFTMDRLADVTLEWDSDRPMMLNHTVTVEGDDAAEYLARLMNVIDQRWATRDERSGRWPISDQPWSYVGKWMAILAEDFGGVLEHELAGLEPGELGELDPVATVY